jgi:5-methyltetrahydropteroyltriglutamate--homocysteine methyltransferase
MASAYRADQVGSFLRPPELLAARDAVAAGRMSADELRRIEDQAILDVIDLQRQTGIDVFTDGELRRRAWMTDLAEAVEGFTPAHIVLDWHGPGGRREESYGQIAGARLHPARRLTEHESRFLLEHAPGPVKMTVPAPSNFLHIGFQPGVTDRFYPTRGELAAEIAQIVRGELLALADEGVAYLQLDAPYYTAYLDTAMREGLRSTGIDPNRSLAEAVAADNAALAGVRREGVVTAIHICRGNSRSRWLGEGGYDAVAEQLFGGLDVDRFLLEYDDERSGGFAPLRFVPRGRTVVLGLVSSKVGRLEDEDELRQRIDEAGRYVPLENLALSPQCGFASVALGNNLTPEEQWQKLELVVRTARDVWG